MNNSSVKVFETRNTTYGLGETLRFEFSPQSIRMINPSQTYLRFFVTVNAEGLQNPALQAGAYADINYMFPWLLNSKIGGASLIRNLTIRTNGTVCEQITDYNKLDRIICNYVENESIENKKRLYEGCDNREVRAVNTLTKRSQNAGTTTAGQENRKIEVLLPLNLSGILGKYQSQPFPNMVAPLTVEILLEEDPFKVLMIGGQKKGLGSDMSSQSNLNTKDNQQYVMGYSTSRPYQVHTMTTPAGPTTALAITNSDGAGHINPDIADNSEVVNYPFLNGSKIVISGLEQNGVALANVEVAVNSVQFTNGRLQLNINSTNFPNNTNATPFVSVVYETSLGKPKIILSDVEFVVGTINPNDAQLANVEKLVSGGGYGYNYRSYMDFPTNINSGVTRSSNYIQCNYQRCKAILSFWEDLGASEIDRDNLAPLLNSQLAPSSYQFNIANLLVPNREVSLNRYNRTRLQSGGWSAIHIKELENALQVCGYDCKDLSDIDGALICASRALVPSGNYSYNMAQQDGETRLNLNFTTNSRPNGLLLHNFVCHTRQLVIKGNEKTVIV